MDTIVDDSQLFLAVVFDGIVFVEVDDVVVGLIEWKFFNKLTLYIGG